MGVDPVLSRVSRLLAAACVVLAAMAAPHQVWADSPAATDNGFVLSDGAIAAYYQRHGGARSLGPPVSNPFRLLGNRVQVFQRQAIAVRPDGSIGTLDLATSYLPVVALGGPALAPDPVLAGRLGSLASATSMLSASGYLDDTAPNAWNGLPVNFGSAFRSSAHCDCDGRVAFALAVDLWGLPIGRPTADPNSSDFVYLRLERGVMVYSKGAGDTQWLLLGQLFKQVLIGGELPPDLVNAIASSPGFGRFYAQYTTQTPDGVARPAELPDTVLAGAFVSASPPPVAAAPSISPSTAAASATPPAQSSTQAAVAVPIMDPRFGIAEGFRAPTVMADLRAGWERVVLPWDQAQPTGPGDFSHLGLTMSADAVQSELDRGVHLSAVLQFTPAWAQADPTTGQRSAPRNLYLPYDDPNNYWAQFVYHAVAHYAGQINEWVIWNEPDIRLSDTGVAGAWTWAGSDEDFAQLLKVAYLAAKQANPNAVIAFPATTYWADELSSPHRPAFYDRVLAILARDPQATPNNMYHDAVALNLYRSPDDVYRVHDVFTAIQGRFGIAKPVWLTEANAAPTDDPLNPCKPSQAAASGPRTTLDQQADYAIQAFALGAAAGYQHVELFDMSDEPTCAGPTWGLVRADGTRRPVADAARTAIDYLSNFTRVRFVPLNRPSERWSAWPANLNSYLPNWQVYQVAFDRPNSQRVTVLWNGDGSPLRVRIPRSGSRARLVGVRGTTQSVQSQGGGWVVDLPAATARYADDQNRDPDGYFYIGGDPQLLIEEGVDSSSPVLAPQLVADS